MTRGPSEDARMDHQPRVLNRHGDAMPGPAACERHAERARQQVLRQRSPGFGLHGDVVIPLLAHEASRHPLKRSVPAMLRGGAVIATKPFRDTRQVIRRIAQQRMKLRSTIIRSPI